jgi:hypothetical protein
MSDFAEMDEKELRQIRGSCECPFIIPLLYSRRFRHDDAREAVITKL